VRFLVARGYTVVAPMRRGRGESSGTSLEECANWAGRCTLSEQIGLFEPGLREALLDLEAVTDQIVRSKLGQHSAKLILSGTSRGGFLALAMAAEHPEIAAGVVNFVGGWFPVSTMYPAEINERRLGLQLVRLTGLGARSRAPTIWIYADRDHAYPDSVTRRFFQAFRKGGGSGEYRFIASHGLESGHQVAEDTTLWAGTVNAFLNRLP
jgi:dienelactone hydrolase